MASNSELNKAQLGSGLRTMDPLKTFDHFMNRVLSINLLLRKGDAYHNTNPDYDNALVQMNVYSFLLELCTDLLLNTKDNRPSEEAWFLLEEVEKVLKALKAVDQDLHLSYSLRKRFNNWCKLNGIEQPEPKNSGGSGSKGPGKRCDAVEDYRPVKYQIMATSEGDDSKGEDSEDKNSKSEDSEDVPSKSEDSEDKDSKSEDSEDVASNSEDSEDKDSKSEESESPNSEDQESESNTDSGESSTVASTNLAEKKETQITIEDQKRVSELLQGPPTEVLVSKFRLQIYRADLLSLHGSNWVADNVINFYMELLNQRAEQHVGQLPSVYAMNTFFLQRLLDAGYAAVKRWTRKIDLFSKQIIPVPYMHRVGDTKYWTMAIIHMRDKTIKYYDSMGGTNDRVLLILKKYLLEESLDKRKKLFSFRDFKFENVKYVSPQDTYNDCGVFCCAVAEYITRDAPFTVEQKDIACLRKKMILEIADGQLRSGGSGSMGPPKRCDAVEDSRPVRYQSMATSEGGDFESGNSEDVASKSEDSEDKDSKSEESESPNSEDQESESNTDSGESSIVASTNLAEKKETQITIEDQKRVSELVQGPPTEVLVSKFRLQISRADLRSLAGNNWLNDNVINFYMELLNQRAEQHCGQLPSVYAMNTFFLPRLADGYSAVRRWTRKVDLFSKQIIPVPVHRGGASKHWTMAIIHMRDKTIKYYDSMGGRNNEVLKSLKKYLLEESLDKRKKLFSFRDFKFENVKNVPRQNNCNDCGVFCCAFAEYITRDAPITFEQKDMAHLRKKMMLEIVDGQLRS